MRISQKTYNIIKAIALTVILSFLLAFTVYINISDAATDKTSDASTYKTSDASTYKTSDASMDKTSDASAGKSMYQDIDYFRDFSLNTFDENVFSNEDFKGYNLIVVNIWEPYCRSCLKEMPVLQELSDEYKDRGLLLIEIQGNAYVYPEDVELGYELIEDLNVSLPMLLADERFSGEILPILNNAFPGTFILDSDGNVLDFTAGAKSKEVWREYFDSFLAK